MKPRAAINRCTGHTLPVERTPVEKYADVAPDKYTICISLLLILYHYNNKDRFSYLYITIPYIMYKTLHQNKMKFGYNILAALQSTALTSEKTVKIIPY
jgi:hypothetical protein